MKVLLPDRHNVSSTLIKLDASIALRLCVFLDEPVLKQLEVRILKDITHYVFDDLFLVIAI